MNFSLFKFPALLIVLALLATSPVFPTDPEPYDFLIDPLESLMQFKVSANLAGTELGSSEISDYFTGSFRNYYSPSLGDFESLQVVSLECRPLNQTLSFEITGEQSHYFISLMGDLQDLRLVMTQESELSTLDSGGKALVSGAAAALQGDFEWEVVVEVELFGKKIEMASVDGSMPLEENSELDFEFTTEPFQGVISGETISANYDILSTNSLNLALEDLFLSGLLNDFTLDFETLFAVQGDAPAPLPAPSRASAEILWVLYE